MFHGGYLPAINDYEKNRTISPATLRTYLNWIHGDILKHNKSEQYLDEILSGVCKCQGTQVSWHSLAKNLSIDHHKTVADYLAILENMQVLSVLPALQEDKLRAAPKKNRKIYFNDPFIYHTVHTSLDNTSLKEVYPLLSKPDFAATIVEGICLNHLKRFFPVYYLKGDKGEVDLAVIINKKLVPLEIKWTTQIRPGDLKQIRKYPKGIILTKNRNQGNYEQLTVMGLIDFLMLSSEKLKTLLINNTV